MYIACWNCGNDVWFETQFQCSHCGVGVRRCLDCRNFDASGLLCQALNIEIGQAESEKPTTLSVSFRCSHYQQTPAAAQRAAERKQHGAAPSTRPEPSAAPTTAGAAPAAPTVRPPAQPPRPAQAAPARPKQPLVIAHRGDPSEAPENTVAAARRAVEVGANVVEFDVHITKDGHLVVTHDASVERCTNGVGLVAEMTLDQIKQLDAGSWFSEHFRGEPVPTLQEMMAAIPAPVWINVHLKSHENESDRAETALVAAIRAANAVDRTYVTHHTRHGLHRIHQKEPKLRLCWLARGGEQDVEYIDDSFYMGYRIIQPNFRVVTQDFVNYAHERGMWVNVFWADEEDHMRELIAMGVDGILTNYPVRLKQVLAETATVSAG
jgi:glycerophosphoryl diester phosphodiesterase